MKSQTLSKLENFTKLSNLSGLNQQSVLNKFIEYRQHCIDELTVHNYMQEKKICVYMLAYWKSKTLLLAELALFDKALECLKRMHLAQKEQSLIIGESKSIKIQIAECIQCIKMNMKTILKYFSSQLQIRKPTGLYELLYQKSQKTSLEGLSDFIRDFNKYVSSSKISKQKMQDLFKKETQKKINSWIFSQYHHLREKEQQKPEQKACKDNHENGNKEKWSSQQLLQNLKHILLYKFQFQGKQLKQKVLQQSSSLDEFTQQNLINLSEISKNQKDRSQMYIQIYVQKVRNEKSLRVKENILAASLFPFDLESAFYQLSCNKTCKRIATQLFYALTFGDPRSAIELRQYISQFYNSKEITQHVMYEIVRSIECDFYPDKNNTVYKVYLTNQQLQKSKITNNGRTIFKVEKNDKYLSDYAQFEQASQWYDSIIESLLQVGVLRKKRVEKIVSEMHYLVSKSNDQFTKIF